MWHTMNGPLVCDIFGQNRANNQFTDPLIVEEVAKAAARVDKPASRTTLRAVGGASPSRGDPPVPVRRRSGGADQAVDSTFRRLTRSWVAQRLDSCAAAEDGWHGL